MINAETKAAGAVAAGSKPAATQTDAAILRRGPRRSGPGSLATWQTGQAAALFAQYLAIWR